MKELLGVLVELLGDVFVVAGYTGQRLATLQTEDKTRSNIDNTSESNDENHISKILCRNSKWFAAFVVFALGQALELVALGLASQSTVVAIGNLSLVFNALASVYVFGEPFALFPKYRGRRLFHQWDGFNLLLLIIGSATTVAFAPIPSPEEEASYDAAELRKMWTRTPFLYFNIALICAMLMLGMCAYRNFKRVEEAKAPMFLASSLAILSAFSVTLSKVISELLGKTISGSNQFQSYSATFMFFVWVIGLVMQLVLLNVGLQNFEQAVFIPMFETMSATITIIFGIIYFRSYDDFDVNVSTVCFCSGVAVLVLGLFLTSRRHSPSREEMVARLNERSPRGNRHQYRPSFSEALEDPLVNTSPIDS